jgi:Galactose oxidase, central domain
MQQNNIFCFTHPLKPFEFYCYNHKTFSCVSCIAEHLDCQLKSKFITLDSIMNKVQASKPVILSDFQKNNEELKKKLSDLENKTLVLSGLKLNDLEVIERFFDEIHAKTDVLKNAAIESYKGKFEKILLKLEEKTAEIREKIYFLEKQKLKFDETSKLLSDSNEEKFLNLISESTPEKILNSIQMKKIPLANLQERQFSSVFIEQEFLDFKNQIKNKLEPINLVDIEDFLNKEEFFSIFGQLTSKYNALQTNASIFIEQHFNEETKDFDEEEEEEEALKFNDLELETDNEKKILQTRFSSNEIYLYDVEKGEFSEYFLFQNRELTVPFIIFNNSASIFVKNKVFFFGGEDPEANFKSSKRVFIANIHQTSSKFPNRLFIHELEEMNNARQEYCISHIGNFIYLISGYNSNLYKDKRVIPKCEKFDLKTKKAYELRDINYPRQSACCIRSPDKNNIYIFGGYNNNYISKYVDKIEKYNIKLNDWSALKFNILDNVEYRPALRSLVFNINESEYLILGGCHENENITESYSFDSKKLVLVKKFEKPINDEFGNQNSVIFHKGEAFVFSGCFANKVYGFGCGQERKLRIIEKN